MNDNFNQISNQEILNGIHELEDYFVKRLQKCNNEVTTAYDDMVNRGALNSVKTNAVIDKVKGQLASLEEEFKKYSKLLAMSMGESLVTITSTENDAETTLGNINS